MSDSPEKTTPHLSPQRRHNLKWRLTPIVAGLIMGGGFLAVSTEPFGASGPDKDHGCATETIEADGTTTQAALEALGSLGLRGSTALQAEVTYAAQQAQQDTVRPGDDVTTCVTWDIIGGWDTTVSITPHS